MGAAAMRIARGYDGQSPEALSATRVRAGHPEGYLMAFANLYKEFARGLWLEICPCHINSTLPRSLQSRMALLGWLSSKPPFCQMNGIVVGLDVLPFVNGWTTLYIKRSQP
jgi:hypothetical protein